MTSGKKSNSENQVTSWTIILRLMRPSPLIRKFWVFKISIKKTFDPCLVQKPWRSFGPLLDFYILRFSILTSPVILLSTIASPRTSQCWPLLDPFDLLIIASWWWGGSLNPRYPFPHKTYENRDYGDVMGRGWRRKIKKVSVWNTHTHEQNTERNPVHSGKSPLLPFYLSRVGFSRDRFKKELSITSKDSDVFVLFCFDEWDQCKDHR